MKPLAPPQALQCERHTATAGWQCTVCNQPLCPDCTATKVMNPITMLVCSLCGEVAEPLIRKKADTATLAQRVPTAWVFPFRGEGLPAWLGISMFLAACSYLGALGALIGWGVTLASLFGLTRSTARGSEHLELSDFQDPLQSILMPIARFALVTFPGWGLVLYGMYTDRPWLNWVALGLTVLWSPTAYIGAATDTSVVHLINPIRVLGVTARLGTDFGVYLAGIFGVGATILVSVPIAMLVNTYLVVPFLGRVATQLVISYGALVGARVAGMVLMLHGPLFGWGEELDLYEPVLGDAQPRGEVPVKRSLPKHLPMSIELEPEPVPEHQAGQQFDRFAAIETNPDAEAPPEVAPLDVALLPSFAQQSAESIRGAIGAGKAEVALDGFRSTGLSAAELLSFDELMWLGQTASAHIDYESAELAFDKAAQRDAPAEALGRARVMLARLLGERLNRKDDAMKWMNRVIAEQPGTQAATYAQSWMAGK